MAYTIDDRLVLAEPPVALFRRTVNYWPGLEVTDSHGNKHEIGFSREHERDSVYYKVSHDITDWWAKDAP